MYAFFYSLYLSLYDGNWIMQTPERATQDLGDIWARMTNWLMNLFGGHFETIQNFNWNISAPRLWATFLAVITITGICFAVLGLVKKIFAIFFSGVR